jgi:hypothetical protein
MDGKAISTMAKTDDEGLIELLLTAHATRLRHAREYTCARRSPLLEFVRAFLPGGGSNSRLGALET